MTDPPDFSPFFFFWDYPFNLKGKCCPCAVLVEKMGRLTYFIHKVSWDKFCCRFAPHKFNNINFNWKDSPNLCHPFLNFWQRLHARQSGWQAATLSFYCILICNTAQNLSGLTGIRCERLQVQITIVFSLAITAFTSLSLNDLYVIFWLL